MSDRRPSYKGGFARHAGESMRPGRWKGLDNLWLPMLGPAGLTLHEWSGHRNHGTLTTMDPATDYTVYPHGYGLDFDGVNDHVLAGVRPAPGHLTIAAWIKMAGDYSNTQAIAGTYRHTNPYKFAQGTLEFGRTNNEFSWLQNGATIDSVSSVGLADDNWHQIAVVRAGGTGAWTISWYFDGVFDKTDATAVNPGNNPYNWTLGKAGNYAGQYFKGSMSMVGTWNRAFNAAEVTDLHADPFALLRLRKKTYIYAPAAPTGNRRRRLLLAG